MESRERGFNLLPYLAGQALLNADFRERLLENPGQAARELGFCLSENQIEQIKAIDPAQVDEWVNNFEGYVGQPVMAMVTW
jgi:hypothetical protein